MLVESPGLEAVAPVPDRLLVRPLRGDWQPRRTHPILLALQLVTLWQAALRGLDYVGGVTAGLDARAADPAYGWLLYGSAVLVLLGLAIRRGGPVILGHALLASWYAGLGVTALGGLVVVFDLRVLLGLVFGGLGTAALLSDRFRTPTRLAGVAAMLLGQVAIVAGLGVDYRAGTGLVAGGAQHAVLAVGTFLLWQRDRLRRQVEHESP
jgi:hypothetical protein